MSTININRLFDVKKFNESPFNDVLITKQQNIAVIFRSVEHKTVYATFDELFSTYLSKLSEGNVKKYVTNIYNKNIVFMGLSNSPKNEIVFTRILLDDSNKLCGVAIDSNSLDIDINTGETDNINDCVYAVYCGLIRSAVFANKDTIVKNKDLHKLMTTYLYRLLLTSLDQGSIINNKQKNFINIVGIYFYYKYFLNQKHPMILSILRKDYKDFFEGDLEEIIPSLETISKYTTISDIPKALVDLNLYNGNPSKIYITLLKKLGPTGFYSLLGGLDQFIAMAIISLYPTELYPKTTLTVEKVHISIEEIIVQYLNTLEYNLTSVLSKSNANNTRSNP